MKRVILSVIMSLAVTVAWSQQHLSIISFSTPEEVIAFTDSLSQKAKRSYAFNRQTPGPGTYKYLEYFVYRDTEPAKPYTTPIELSFCFRKEYEGRNVALEIEGTLSYVFNEVAGKFMDIIPFWLAYVEPDADLETLSKQFMYERKEVVDGRTLSYTLRVERGTGNATILFRKI